MDKGRVRDRREGRAGQSETARRKRVWMGWMYESWNRTQVSQRE